MNRWEGVFVATSGGAAGAATLHELSPPPACDIFRDPFLMPMVPRLADPNVADEANWYAIQQKRRALDLVRTKVQQLHEFRGKANANKGHLHFDICESGLGNGNGGQENPLSSEMHEINVAPAPNSTDAALACAHRDGQSSAATCTTIKPVKRKESVLERVKRSVAKFKASIEGTPAAHRYYLYFPELSRGVSDGALGANGEDADTLSLAASAKTGGRIGGSTIDSWVGEFRCSTIHRNTSIDGFAIITDRHLCFVSERGMPSHIGSGSGYQIRSAIALSDIIGIQECSKQSVDGVALALPRDALFDTHETTSYANNNFSRRNSEAIIAPVQKNAIPCAPPARFHHHHHTP